MWEHLKIGHFPFYDSLFLPNFKVRMEHSIYGCLVGLYCPFRFVSVSILKTLFPAKLVVHRLNHLILFLLFGWAYCVSPFGLLFKVSSFLFVLIKFHGANARIAWWSPGSGTSQLGFVPACIIKKFLHCSSPKITGRATAYGNGADLQYYQG